MQAGCLNGKNIKAVEVIGRGFIGACGPEPFVELPHPFVALAHVEVRRGKAQVVERERVHHQRRFNRGLTGAAAAQDPRAPTIAAQCERQGGAEHPQRTGYVNRVASKKVLSQG